MLQEVKLLPVLRSSLILDPTCRYFQIDHHRLHNGDQLVDCIGKLANSKERFRERTDKR
jgi:hypothetical protein